MHGGTISGNIVRGNPINGMRVKGGGVAVTHNNASAIFIKTGGIIYGSEASADLRNIVTDLSDNILESNGHAAWVWNAEKIRNSTALAAVNLISGVTGAVGGWEN
jgi:hypothetical protein